MSKLLETLKSRPSQNKEFALTRLENFDVHLFARLYNDILKDPREDFYVEFDVKPFSEEKYFATTPTERKKLIEEKVPYYHAAGVMPILNMSDGQKYLAMPYRDAGAPTLPDTFTPTSGLPDLIDGKQEEISKTMKREGEEELVFVDQDMKEIKIKPKYPSQKILKDIYNMNITSRNFETDEVIEEFNSYTLGYAGPWDTVGTVMGLALYDLEFSMENLNNNFSVINGEASGFSRDLGLFNLDSIYKGKLEGVVSHSEIKEDLLSYNYISEKIKPERLTAPAHVVVEKIIRSGKDVLLKQLEQFA